MLKTLAFNKHCIIMHILYGVVKNPSFSATTQAILELSKLKKRDKIINKKNQ